MLLVMDARTFTHWHYSFLLTAAPLFWIVNFVGLFSGLQIVGEQELGFHLTFEVFYYYYFRLHEELLSSFVFIFSLKKKVVFLPQFSYLIYSSGKIFNGLSIFDIVECNWTTTKALPGSVPINTTKNHQTRPLRYFL